MDTLNHSYNFTSTKSSKSSRNSKILPCASGNSSTSSFSPSSKESNIKPTQVPISETIKGQNISATCLKNSSHLTNTQPSPPQNRTTQPHQQKTDSPPKINKNTSKIISSHDLITSPLSIPKTDKTKLLSSSQIDSENDKNSNILNCSTISSNSSNTFTSNSQDPTHNQTLVNHSNSTCSSSFEIGNKLISAPVKPPRINKSPSAGSKLNHVSSNSSGNHLSSMKGSMFESNSAVDSLDKILADLEIMNWFGDRDKLENWWDHVHN